MSGDSSCSNNGYPRYFSYASSSYQPWVCNQFGQIPPDLGPCNPSATGMSYVKQAQLGCYGEDISNAFYMLSNSMVSQTDQAAVLATQKPLLITAMTTYNAYTTDPQTIFDRDGTVNDIMQAITTSITALSNDPNYTTYTTQLATLQTAVTTYFQYAGSSQ